MAKVISLFNHKGGVSKTTTAFNLGWELANNGKKVLLVDLDSQCNLTGLIFGYQKINDGLDAYYQSRENLTLLSVIDSFIDGASPDSVLSSNDNAKLLATGNKNLFLLPGHLRIADLDSQISVALKIALGVPATKNLPGALPEFIHRLADIYKFDVVICDMSPNIGGLNEIMLMSSDCFIVPTAPDFFSWQAVLSLKNYVTAWHREINAFKEAVPLKATAFLSNSPKFLGTIQQCYRIRNQAPAKSFQKWIDAIRDTVDNDLVPALDKIGCLKPRDQVQKVLDSCDADLQAYDLAHIADFNSLIAISQNLMKPIFEITDDELKAAKQFGWSLNTMETSRDNFKSTFSKFSSIVDALI